jgi:uncharacterized cupredoxin-like copper-binding protein
MIQFRKIILPPAFFLMLLSAVFMASQANAGHKKPAGQPGTVSEVSRDIKVTQLDNMFLPDEIRVTEGETVRFIIINKGNHQHEMLIGTMRDLRKAAKMRRNNPDGNSVEPGMIRLQPDEQGELVWTFDQAGEFDFACPLPGHFKAMRGKIYVEKK